MFSVEEFEIMVYELLEEKPASFDMLCRIAEKTLRPSVRRWCAADGAIGMGAFEEDVMQEIYVKLIKTCTSSFLLRNGVDGPINHDPEGFKNWMFRVALNVKRDFAANIRKITMNSRAFEEGEEKNVADTSGESRELEALKNERLARAFEIVLDSDNTVYKVLTWMAQSIFIVSLDITKIRSTELVLQQFEKRTLCDMRDMVFFAATKITWINITDKQRSRVERALAEPYDEKRKYGAVEYREFFMKKGGKATISDWVNRMNNLIKRVIEHEALNN